MNLFAPDRSLKLAAITCDTDWAADETMRHAHGCLAALGHPITYFLTGPYDVVREPSPVPIELAPHPNFQAGHDLDAEVSRCMAWAPRAVCFRAHSLHWTERLRPVMRRHRLRVSSSALMYLQPGIAPFPIGHELLEVPIFWMDAFHLEYCSLAGTSSVDLKAMRLDQPGLKVLDIHPLHAVRNTPTMAAFLDAKPYWKDHQALLAQRTSERGMWDLFAETVARLEALDYEFCLLSEIAARAGGVGSTVRPAPAPGSEGRGASYTLRP